MNNNEGAVKAPHCYDIAIIGGGVNGTAIARDAAGRGHSVVLLEKGDLASGTSSASTKLIHGGLRYLEYGELRLVKKALAEREVFLKTAPHIVSPMRFVIPLPEKGRPAWMVRVGLGLYDHLARRDVLPNAERIKTTEHDFVKPLFGNLRGCFAYSDCWVDDARMVVLQAVDARRQGAAVWPRTGVRDITPANGLWEIETDTDRRIHARMVVNAAGPWVRQLLEKNGLAQPSTPKVRLVRGSHIIVPAIFEGDQSYLLQQPDGRVVFAIPYEHKFTLIGTTDVEHTGGPDAPPHCTPDEAAYLCDAVNRYFTKQTLPAQIVWSYSGVRPLFDDGRGKAAAVTRDYHLHASRHQNAPMLSVYGGKITTARVLAEAVLADAEKIIGRKAGPWTSSVPLPGGDIVDRDFHEFLADMAAHYHWFEGDALLRYARAYGSWLGRILGSATRPEQLGRNFGHGLFEAEVEYLRDEEWARSADDILWRRTKLGLHVSPDTANMLRRHIGE
ncbi:MAG: glycerol-3-phosphate dehydrogenase [Alphaproteobacteria bacterium]|nr:glycerol-3-phosphate dehydrogenase [Alphaproteobacteria bacterium]